MVRELCLLLLFLSGLWVSWRSYFFSKQGQFYSDTPQWWWLSVFIWGDGLVLGPLWCTISLLALLLSFNLPGLFWIFCLVHAVRSYFEIHYWIAMQTHDRITIPVILRRFKWIQPHDSAILFQVFHTCIVILFILGTVHWFGLIPR